MENQLDTLVNKLYSEGTAKAHEDSKNILDKAQADANSIIKKAQQEAEAIKLQSQSDSQKARQSTQDDCKRLVRDSLDFIMNKIANLVSKDFVEKQSKLMTTDTGLMSKVFLKCMESFSLSTGLPSIDVHLSKELKEAVSSQMAKELEAKIKKTIQIIDSKSGKSGFVLADNSGSWKISFDEDSLIEYLTPFMTKRIRELIEGKN